MLDKIFSFRKPQYKSLKILIVEPNDCYRALIEKIIKDNRSHHELILAKSLEEVFSLLYQEVNLDIIFFDIEPELNTDDLTIIHAISPNTALIHWSNCKHPEVIELLYNLGVNFFCLKNSQLNTIIEAIDSAQSNNNILYLDSSLNKCLPLLANYN